MEPKARGNAGVAVFSAVSIGLVALWAAPAPAGTPGPDTLGKTTLEQAIVPDEATGYNQLELDP